MICLHWIRYGSKIPNLGKSLSLCNKLAYSQSTFDIILHQSFPISPQLLTTIHAYFRVTLGTCQVGVWKYLTDAWSDLNRATEMASSLFLYPLKLAISLFLQKYVWDPCLVEMSSLLWRLSRADLELDRGLATKENPGCLRAVQNSSYRRCDPFHLHQTKI